MPVTDAIRWNDRYRQGELSIFKGPRPFLVEHASLLPSQGLAIDVAMGLGGNAGFLLERGLRVVGIDISWVAVRQTKARWPDLLAVVADLTRFYLPDKTFDLVINFYYLQRDLWPVYARALKPGGILFLETLTRSMLEVHPEIDPAYLLEPGELRRAFADWEILEFYEGWDKKERRHPRATARLIARRPV